jgi:hypothetical protein
MQLARGRRSGGQGLRAARGAGAATRPRPVVVRRRVACAALYHVVEVRPATAPRGMLRQIGAAARQIGAAASRTML